MALIFIGLIFGLIVGAGLFFLLIFPALRERKREEQQQQIEREEQDS